MQRHLAIVPAVLVALFAAGCGPAGASGAGSSSGNATDISHPSGARDIVVRVSTAGGFVAPATTFRTVPEFTLYGDGTVIVPGAVAAIYPGPALDPLNTFKLSEQQVQALLTKARDAGLLEGGPVDYGDMGSVGITDMPTTTVVLNAGGTQVKAEAYALSAGAMGGGLTAAHATARRALAGFVAGLPNGSSAGGYTPSALAVYAGPFEGEPQIDATPMVWPLQTDLATTGAKVSEGLPYRCIAVTGGDAETLLTELGSANDQTQWLAHPDSNRTFGLIIRPLLPDETPCSR
jgi:hypothetical protein